MKKSITLFLVFCVIAVNAQTGNLDSVKLNVHINKLISRYNIPGADIAVLRNDSVIYRYLESKNSDKKNYLIGSCSKSFTALTVLMLTEKGKIDLDKPVKAYLPWFVVKDTKSIDQITVRHLLNQSSGIGSQYGFFDYKTNDDLVFKSKLTELLATAELVNAPGKAFCYSNLNYLLLGLVVESVTHEKYSTYLTNNVFQRIGMKTTYAGLSGEILQKNSEPYQYYFFNQPFQSKFYPHSDYALAFGYVSSNISDLCVYLSFLMNHGITKNDDTLINTKSYESLVTPVNGFYAMGWGKMKYNGIDMLIHTGLDENFSSVLSFSPDTKIGVVVLSNINSLEFCSLAQSSIIDMLAQKPFFQPFSMELALRWIPDTLAIFTLLLLFFNFYRWKKYGLNLGLLFKVSATLRLILGIALSLLCIFLIRKTYGISIFSVINFEPDIVWGVLLIAIFGTLSSFTRYFGAYAKEHNQSKLVV